jgi:hypothetical protein
MVKQIVAFIFGSVYTLLVAHAFYLLSSNSIPPYLTGLLLLDLFGTVGIFAFIFNFVHTYWDK